jgi:hypothetical protein
LVKPWRLVLHDLERKYGSMSLRIAANLILGKHNPKTAFSKAVFGV